jgi:hypothetical protein
MAQGTKRYGKKLRRHASDGTTTRHIVVEENSEGIQLIVYEFRPTKDKYGSTIGYEFHPLSRKWCLTLKQPIIAADSV